MVFQKSPETAGVSIRILFLLIFNEKKSVIGLRAAYMRWALKIRVPDH